MCDAYGRISSTAKVTVEMSPGMHERLMKRANSLNLSDAAYGRLIIERELMVPTITEKPRRLRVENGMVQIVHCVTRKGEA